MCLQCDFILYFCGLIFKAVWHFKRPDNPWVMVLHQPCFKFLISQQMSCCLIEGQEYIKKDSKNQNFFNMLWSVFECYWYQIKVFQKQHS